MFSSYNWALGIGLCIGVATQDWQQYGLDFREHSNPAIKLPALMTEVSFNATGIFGGQNIRQYQSLSVMYGGCDVQGSAHE